MSLPACGLIAVLVLLSGCATVEKVNPAALVADCDNAVNEARENPVPRNSNGELLYYMQLATLEHACRDYDSSIRNFEQAKRIDDALYGVSISESATSFLISDTTRAYTGQNFERVMLRLFNAMNYSILDRQESALVEARQTDFLLSQLNRDQGGRNVYDEDAFGRFLTGMLYQEAGDIDNANVSFLLALEAYENNVANYGVRIPQPLLAAAAENARRHSQQAVERVADYGQTEPRSLPAGAGEVVLFYQVGLVPEKIEQRITIAWRDGLPYLNGMQSNDADAKTQQTIDIAATIAATDSLTVAFPKYVRRPYSVRELEIDAPGALSISQPSLLTDIGRIAVKDLEDHIVRIRAKTVARAAFYYASLQLLEKKMRDDGSPEFMIQVAKAAEKVRQIVFERADIRQWDSLPDQIKMISIVLPEGEHTIRIRRAGLVDETAAVPLADLNVTVVDGQRTFASVRTVL